MLVSPAKPSQWWLASGNRTRVRVIAPLHFRQQGQYVVMPVSEYMRNESSKWNLHCMFKENYGDPETRADLGVKDDMMERIAAALQSVWENSAPTQLSGDAQFNTPYKLQP
eukprot:1582500-Rhodomonas_salina.1